MKNLLYGLALFLSYSGTAHAQDTTTSTIAMLFDSPIFFGGVIGSAAFILLLCLLLVFYARNLEKKALAWGQDKGAQDIIALVQSGDATQSQLAYVYLKNYLKEEDFPLLIAELQSLRDSHSVSERILNLVGDLRITAATPILESLAKGKSSNAALASQVLRRIPSPQEESPKEDSKKSGK